MYSFRTNGAQTVKVILKDFPDEINVVDKSGKLVYFRRLSGKYHTIKFNILRPGSYSTDVDCMSIETGPLELSPVRIELPPPMRNRFGDFEFVYNEKLTGTPARNYTLRRVIEYGPKYKSYPQPIRLFILLHEVAHFFYGVERKDFADEASFRVAQQQAEEACDLYAAREMLAHGYNESTVFYALSQVLTQSKRNTGRVYNLLNQLKQRA